MEVLFGFLWRVDFHSTKSLLKPFFFLMSLFLLVYLYLPSFPCIYPSLYLCLSISLVYNPPLFSDSSSLYKLLLYLNFRIVLEKSKTKRKNMTNCSVLIRKLIKENHLVCFFFLSVFDFQILGVFHFIICHKCSCDSQM